MMKALTITPLLVAAALLSCSPLCSAVSQSIIPSMDQLMITNLQEKITPQQLCEIKTTCLENRLRVISFNMLFNWSETHLEPVDRWDVRKARVIEYIQWAHPDVIGSQELQSDQLDDVLSAIADDYGYYGIGTDDGVREGDIPAIFYRKKRLELLKGQTFYFSQTPEKISCSPFGNKNTFTFCHFRDKQSGDEFLAINTHLAFGNIQRRYYEACQLRDFLLAHPFQLPLLITGDFNTFAFRQDLDLPFFDGDQIVQIVEEGGVCDSLKAPLFGHFGLISSTNFCSKEKKPFCSLGNPGIILDHVFVNRGFKVLAHGIDPAKVDDHFPSDHFPVIVDLLIR